MSGARAGGTQEATSSFISMTSLLWLVGDDAPHQPAHLAGIRNALKFLCTAAARKMSEDCDAESWLLAGGNSLALSLSPSLLFFLASSKSAWLELRELQGRKSGCVLGEDAVRVKDVLGSSVLHTLSAGRVLPLKTFCSSGLWIEWSCGRFNKRRSLDRKKLSFTISVFRILSNLNTYLITLFRK